MRIQKCVFETRNRKRETKTGVRIHSNNNFDKLNLDEEDENYLNNWKNSKGNRRGISIIKKNLEKRRKEKENNNIKEYDEKEDN